jgi:argininosuccinate synthase
MAKDKVRKVVLAYSGGLDTSVIVPWLKNNFDNCEVICFTADVGQQEELNGLEEKALASGAAKLIVSDLREEFLRDYVFPTMQAGAVYEREYLLGTSVARPLMAKKMVEIAETEGADAIAHGCTGKGNDQVRFELTVMALNPKLKVIAPGASGKSAAGRMPLNMPPNTTFLWRKPKRIFTAATATSCTFPTRGDCWKIPGMSRSLPCSN